MKYTGFTIAVRYNRSFSIADNVGAIVDTIISHSSNDFNQTFFTQLNTIMEGKILTNPIFGHSLSITIDNIILDYITQSNFDEEFDKYTKIYCDIILNQIFKQFNIQKINRFGIIIKSQLQEGNSLYNKIFNTLSETEKNIESFSFRYNKIVNRPIKINDLEMSQDYNNEILTFDRASSKTDINFLVDYQKYFNPPLKYITDAKPHFDSFVKKSLEQFKENYDNK